MATPDPNKYPDTGDLSKYHELIQYIDPGIAKAVADQFAASTGVIQRIPKVAQTSGLTFTPRKDDRSFEIGGLSAEEMLAIRLRLKSGQSLPLRHIAAFCDDKTAVVMVVLPNGKAVMIEDDVNLYPSDTLITQLRLLMETGS